VWPLVTFTAEGVCISILSHSRCAFLRDLSPQRKAPDTLRWIRPAWRVAIVDPANGSSPPMSGFRAVFGITAPSPWLQQVNRPHPSDDQARVQEAVAAASRIERPRTRHHRTPGSSIPTARCIGCSPKEEPTSCRQAQDQRSPASDGTVAEHHRPQAGRNLAITILESISDAFFSLKPRLGLQLCQSPGRARSSVASRAIASARHCGAEYPGLHRQVNSSPSSRRAMTQRDTGFITAFYRITTAGTKSTSTRPRRHLRLFPQCERGRTGRTGTAATLG